ncbi:hypothetical protein ABVK25_004624 [Lepraria finkii]|uniref:Uncharacterized protein n=1 Tax=Lepraria finkii TaxID=1340010 RepID=A0ABR4BBQ7_9LECA
MGSEHEGKGKSPFNSDIEGKQSALQMMLGSEATGLTADMTSTLLEEIQGKGVLGIDALAEELDSAPDLAFIWMPPMDFTPPEEDFEVEDDDLVPRREDSMFGGDIFHARVGPWLWQRKGRLFVVVAIPASGTISRIPLMS